METPTAGPRVARNLEVLRSIGEHIGDRKFLCNLCLTSKIFHLAFSPRLYRHLNTSRDAFRLSADNPNLIYNGTGLAASDRWHPSIDYSEALVQLYRQDLSHFGNLTYLAVDDLFDDLSRWRRQIHKGNSDYAHFFDGLCRDYAESGGHPLELRTLKCGLSIYPMSYEGLTGLTKLAYLEEVEIDNDGELHEDSGVFELHTAMSECKIVLQAFGPTNCPRFADSQCHTIAKKHTSFSANSPSSPMLLCSSEEHPELPVKLRMMELDLDRENYAHSRPPKQILEDLAASNGAALEGLVLNLADPDSIEFTDDVHPQDLVQPLSSITKLTQLRIMGPGYEENSSVLGKKLALACPNLQYIQFPDKDFKVRRYGPDSRDVELEEMGNCDFEAWEGAELLRFSTFHPVDAVS
ncbi:hypothetical protein B0T21DRAFT_391273 [Apiosordaria backusii]|uniref:Uncharacterized protein n=1 Tax=Apiosordaria backusii TaxID=314023 RepID=A0AA40EEY1_9PEZI|nr:hypothetical protein B0T21DRAFT_391273 [Apiosordaria backusii]